jgi:fatty-acid desaturase
MSEITPSMRRVVAHFARPVLGAQERDQRGAHAALSFRPCHDGTMHWYIRRLAHTRGPQSWMIDGVGTTGDDVPLFAIPAMDESWHNNHHAFPVSARHGLFPGQFDPGFRFIQLLQRLGLAWDIQTPKSLIAAPG